MKDELRRLFLATLADLSLDRVIPRRVAVRGSTLEIDDDRIDLDPFKKIIIDIRQTAVECFRDGAVEEKILAQLGKILHGLCGKRIENRAKVEAGCHILWCCRVRHGNSFGYDYYYT